MAGDWIKMQCSLHDNPKVIRVARDVGLDRYAVLGRLQRLWSWASTHTLDGNLPGMSLRDIDSMLECEGFAKALLSVSWVEEVPSPGGLRLPRWDEHNTSSAKMRAMEQRKKQRQRDGNADPAPVPRRRPASVPMASGHDRDQIESKRREEKIPAAQGLKAQPAAGSRMAGSIAGEAKPATYANLNDRNRIVAAWNKQPKVRKAGHGDARWLQAALDSIADGGWASDDAKRDPIEWLCQTIAAYGGSNEGRECPTSLFAFLRDGKYTQPVEAWNHRQPTSAGEPGSDPEGDDVDAHVRSVLAAPREGAER